jgi:hypothetical protein
VTDWRTVATEKQARFESTHGALDERALVRRGNTAYAAALALLMLDADDAPLWFRRAAESWRASWELAAEDAWGRPLGVLKACLLADEEAATAASVRWALDLEAEQAASPIGRYTAALALLAAGRFEHAVPVAESLRALPDFPHDVGDAALAVATADERRVQTAVASVVESFETRDAYLEDVAVADTALVLVVLAERRGLAVDLAPSPVLPTTRPRPARSPGGTQS